MADDRRQDAATATTGAALLAAGGTLRHHAVRRAYPDVKAQPKVHALAMLRRAPKGKKQFWAGSVIGALGLPPLAVGATHLVRGDVDKGLKVQRKAPVRVDRRYGYARIGNQVGHKDGLTDDFYRLADREQHRRQGGLHRALGSYTSGPVSHYRPVASRRRTYVAGATLLTGGLVAARKRTVDKADQDKRGFWREGLRGTGEALKARAQSYQDPVPVKLRAAQAGFGAGVGALGSLAARAALGRRGNALKPVLTPVAGGLAATASVPLSNKVVTRRHPEYEVTASGVRRKKTPAKMPSTKSSPYRPSPRSFRTDVGKSWVGGAWKPAASLTAGERRIKIATLRTARRAAPRPIHTRGPRASDSPLNRELHAFHQVPVQQSSHPKVHFAASVPHHTRQMILGATPRKLKHPVHIHTVPGMESHGALRRRGNRPAMMLLRPDQPGHHMNVDPHIYRHELAHSQVKGTMGRNATLRDQPLKGIREEARADTAAQRAYPQRKPHADYEFGSILHTDSHRGARRVRRALKPALAKNPLTSPAAGREYKRMRAKLGSPIHHRRTIPGTGYLSPQEKQAAIEIGVPTAALGGTALAAHLINRRNRKDVTKFAPRIMFHGTSEANADSIERTGFRDVKGFRGVGTYAANNPQSALNFTSRNKAKPAVLRVAHVGPMRDSEPGHLPGSTYHLVDSAHVHAVGREALKRGLRGVALAKADKPALYNPWGRGHVRYARKIHSTEISIRAHEKREKLKPGRFIYGVHHGEPTWNYMPANPAPGRHSFPVGQHLATRRTTAVKKSAADDAKSRSYQGSRTPYIRQRAAITAAGHPPVIGPFTSAAAAARYAPPGQERKQAVRQWAMGSGAGFPIGAAGAYAGAHLTARSSAAEGVANDALKVKHAAHAGARKLIGLKPKQSKGPGRATRTLLESRFGKPFRTKAGAVGGAVGFVGAKMASGGVLGQTAISLNQRDQKRYNKAHEIAKAAGPGQTKREKHQLAQRKRRSAVLADISGTAGLASLGLLATGHRHPAVTLGTVGAGVGGVNSLLGSRVQRQEAKAVDPVRKIAPRVVYHGTTEAGAKAIMREGGFNPAHKATYGPGTYTGDERLARRWARRRGGRKGHVVRVVAVGPVRSEGEHPSGGTYHLWDPTHISPAGVHHRSGLSGWQKAGIGAGGAAVAGGAGYEVHRQVSKRVPRSSLEAAAAWHSKLHQLSDGLVAVPKAHRRAAAAGLRSLAANPAPLLTMGSKAVLRKAAPLEIKGSKHEHHQLLRAYGDKGPLPKGLDRDTRMKAWEARYVHHGGDKQNRYARRAEIGEGVKNAGLAVATTGGAAWLAARNKRGAALVRRHPHLSRHAETTAVAGATVGGAGEMLAGWAHHRQSSYANSPGGVAASALRRMRDNTPDPS